MKITKDVLIKFLVTVGVLVFVYGIFSFTSGVECPGAITRNPNCLIYYGYKGSMQIIIAIGASMTALGISLSKKQ